MKLADFLVLVFFCVVSLQVATSLRCYFCTSCETVLKDDDIMLCTYLDPNATKRCFTLFRSGALMPNRGCSNESIDGCIPEGDKPIKDQKCYCRGDACNGYNLTEPTNPPTVPMTTASNMAPMIAPENLIVVISMIFLMMVCFM